MASYWNKVLNRRINRRRGLALAGGSAATAAFIAACGGDDGGDGGPEDSSGLVSEIQDTSDAARRGGALKWYSSNEPLHFDGQAQGQAQLNVFNGLAYGSLVQNKPGFMEPSTNTEVVGDLAESWEFSPDKTSVIFKLRQDVKWQNKAPVNGRAFDSDDVVKNWERYVSLPSNNRAANANQFNPNAPIVSVSAPDRSTVIYKLNAPTSFILQRLATMITGEAGTQLPKEAGTAFDPRTDQIGTGGFILDRFTPSASVTYRRNPDYWNKQEPYVDAVEMPILPQYPTALAQFKTGAIHAYPVLATDVVATKNETPALKMYRNLAAAANPAAMIGLGWAPLSSGEKSPFLDIRVRQALSLSFDRDAFIDAFFNVSDYEADGLPVETFYFTSMGYLPDVTLDPRDREFGANAQYYTYNPTEAKKLIDAAYPNGMPEIESKRITGGQFGLDHQNQVEVLDGWAREVGFKLSAKPIDYNLEYLPQIVTQQGKFNGWAYRFGATSSADPLDYFVWRYWSKSGPTSGSLGFGGPDGGLGDQSGDPEADRLIESALGEVDNNRRIAIIKDLQRHLAKQQYGVTRPGLASGFTLAWPALGNAQVFQGDSRGASAGAPGTPFTWWLDPEQPPIKPA
jgi:peptide/nickel transport system substrate-binding protein